MLVSGMAMLKIWVGLRNLWSDFNFFNYDIPIYELIFHLHFVSYFKVEETHAIKFHQSWPECHQELQEWN